MGISSLNPVHQAAIGQVSNEKKYINNWIENIGNYALSENLDIKLSLEGKSKLYDVTEHDEEKHTKFIDKLSDYGIKRDSNNKKNDKFMREEFLKYLYEEVLKDKNNFRKGDSERSVKMLDLLGEKGLLLYKAAILEESMSREFREAVLQGSSKKYDGPKWKEKLVLWVGGPSGAGKSYASSAVVKNISKEIPKFENDKSGNIVVSVDGGVEREMSQIRQLMLQVALFKGYKAISDLHTNTKLGIKSKIKKAVMRSEGLNLVIPRTFTNPKEMKAILAKKYEKDTKFHHAFCMVEGEDPKEFQNTVEGLGVGRATLANNKEFSANDIKINNLDIGCESKVYEPQYFKYGLHLSRNARKMFEYFNVNGSSLIVKNDLNFVKHSSDNKLKTCRFDDEGAFKLTARQLKAYNDGEIVFVKLNKESGVYELCHDGADPGAKLVSRESWSNYEYLGANDKTIANNQEKLLDEKSISKYSIPIITRRFKNYISADKFTIEQELNNLITALEGLQIEMPNKQDVLDFVAGKKFKRKIINDRHKRIRFIQLLKLANTELSIKKELNFKNKDLEPSQFIKLYFSEHLENIDNKSTSKSLFIHKIMNISDEFLKDYAKEIQKISTENRFGLANVDRVVNPHNQQLFSVTNPNKLKPENTKDKSFSPTPTAKSAPLQTILPRQQTSKTTKGKSPSSKRILHRYNESIYPSVSESNHNPLSYLEQVKDKLENRDVDQRIVILDKQKDESLSLKVSTRDNIASNYMITESGAQNEELLFSVPSQAAEIDLDMIKMVCEDAVFLAEEGAEFDLSQTNELYKEHVKNFLEEAMQKYSKTIEFVDKNKVSLKNR